MDKHPRISLIFVNYHSTWQLSLALESLFSIEGESVHFEVIVVNNDKREESALRHVAKQFPFRLISSPSNVGFGQGINMGVAEASGEIVGFLNPDIAWQQPILSRVGDFFQSQEPSILGITLVGRDGEQEPWSNGVAPSLWELFRNNIVPRTLARALSPSESLNWVSGGGLFLKKSSFQDIGGFDEQFFLYFEDVDLCVRAGKQGMKIVCRPELTLQHLGGKSFSRLASQKKHFYVSQLRYFAKHRPALETFCLRVLHRMIHAL